jgi:hypothetical protein
MEPSMQYFIFPTSSYTQHPYSVFLGCVIKTMQVSTALFLGTFGLSFFIETSSLVLAEEMGEAKELPRRVLRHTPSISKEWTFEKYGQSNTPSDFFATTLGAGRPAEWTLTKQDGAPSASHVLRQSAPCSSDNCYQVLISEKVRAKYMDLSVGILANFGTPTSGAGLIFNAQDGKNFLAVLVYPATNTAKAFQFIDGKPILLKEEEVFPKKRTPWHFMRIHQTSIVSREVVELSFDNKFLISLEPKSLKSGNVGLITTGDGIFAFDNLKAVEITTGIPISRPPAN